METAYYSENELPYGRLSNHAHAPFTMDDGVRFKSVTNFVYANVLRGKMYAFLEDYTPEETPRVFKNVFENEKAILLFNACKIGCEHKLYQSPDLLHDLRMSGKATLTYPRDDILAPYIAESLMRIRATINEVDDTIAQQRIVDAFLAEKILSQKIQSGESNLSEFVDVPAYQIVDEHGPEMRDMYLRDNILAQYRSNAPGTEILREEVDGADGTLALLLRAKYANEEEKIVCARDYSPGDPVILRCSPAVYVSGGFNARRKKQIEKAVLNSFLEKSAEKTGTDKLKGVIDLFKLSPEMRAILTQKAMDVYAKRPEMFTVSVPAEIRPEELTREAGMIAKNKARLPSQGAPDAKVTQEIPAAFYEMGEPFFVDAMSYPSIAHYMIAVLFAHFVIPNRNLVEAHNMLLTPGEDRWKTVEEIDADGTVRSAMRDRILFLNKLGNEQKFRDRELQSLLKSTGNDRLFFVDYHDKVLGYDDCPGYENGQGELLMNIRKTLGGTIVRLPVSVMSEDMSQYVLSKASELVDVADQIKAYIKSKFRKEVECPRSGAALTSVLYYLFGCGRMMTLGDVNTLTETTQSTPLIDSLGVAAKTQLRKYMSVIYSMSQDMSMDLLKKAMEKRYEQTIRMRKNADRILEHYAEKDMLKRVRENVAEPGLLLPFKSTVEKCDLLNYGTYAILNILAFLRQISAPFSREYVVEEADVQCIATLLKVSASAEYTNTNMEAEIIRMCNIRSITVSNEIARRFLGMILEGEKNASIIVFYSRITIYPIYLRRGRAKMVRVREVVREIAREMSDEPESDEEEDTDTEEEEDIGLVEEEGRPDEEEDEVDDVPFEEEEREEEEGSM